MARVIKFNWGWRLSRSALLDQVDADRLARELDVRGVTCEMPQCNATAFSVIPTGVTGLICFNHSIAHQSSPQVAAAIEAAIKFVWQGQMAITTNAAYEDADDHVVTTFSMDGGLLEKAKLAARGAEEIMRQEARKLAAVALAPPVAETTQVEPKVRPTLNHLEDHNTPELLFDPFIV